MPKKKRVPSQVGADGSGQDSAAPVRLSRRQFGGLVGAGAFAAAVGAAGAFDVIEAEPAAATAPGSGAVLRRSGVSMGSWGSSTANFDTPFGSSIATATDRFGAVRAFGKGPVDVVAETANGSNGGSGTWTQIESGVLAPFASTSYGASYAQKLVLNVAPWPVGSVGTTASAITAAWSSCASNHDPAASTTPGYISGAGGWTAHYVTLVNNAIAAGITTLYLRLFWDFNYTGSPWLATTAGSPPPDVAHFIAAWQLLQAALKTAAGTSITLYFVFSPRSGDDTSGGVDEQAYPGDTYVDMIAPTVYDVANSGSQLPGASLGTPIYPAQGFKLYDQSTNYVVGDKVAYYSGFYVCIAANGPSSTVVNPNYRPGQSGGQTCWNWYPFSDPTLGASAKFSATERTSLAASQRASWNYTLYGTGASTSRALEFWRRFAAGATVGNYTGGARTGPKRFSIAEWGLSGRGYDWRDGKDNAYWMQQMMRYQQLHIPVDSVAYDIFFAHDNGLSTSPPTEGYHNVGAPWGESPYTTYAPYAAFPRAGFIYQCAFSNRLWAFNGGYGTVNANVAATDTGSGGPLTYAVANSPATLTYSSANAPSPYSTSVLANSNGAAQAAYIERSTGLSTGTPAVRCYVYRTANPANTMTLMRVMRTTSLECFRVQLNTSGYLVLTNASTATVTTMTQQTPLNAWYRVDAAVNITTGEWEITLTLAGNGDDPMYEQRQTGTAASSAFGSSGDTATIFKFGNCVSTNSGSTWIADCAIGDGPIGPRAVPRISGAFLGDWGTPAGPSLDGNWYADSNGSLAKAYGVLATTRGRGLDMIKVTCATTWAAVEGAGVSVVANRIAASPTWPLILNKMLLSVGGNPGGLAPGTWWANANATPRVVTTGATTNGSTTLTSSTANFTANDVGVNVVGTGLPFNSYIVTVNSATSVTLNQAATATATGVSLTIGRYDNHYLKLADTIAAAGITDVRLAMFWEFNGYSTVSGVVVPVMPWAAIGNTAAPGGQSQAQNDYVTFWRRIIPAIRARQAGVTFRFVWCPGLGDGFSAPSVTNGCGPEGAYPGDDVVDEIAGDIYDCHNSGFTSSGYPQSPNGYPGTQGSFPQYIAGTSYTSGSSKVAYTAGFYVANRTASNLIAPPLLAQKSNADWNWYPQSSMTATELANLAVARETAWIYLTDGSNANSRCLTWLRRFATDDPTLLSTMTLDSRATRAGAKPLGLHEWGLMGRIASDDGKDNPAFMTNMLEWISTNAAWDCLFTHNIGLPNETEAHGAIAPDGDTTDFPTAPPLFGQLAEQVYITALSAP